MARAAVRAKQAQAAQAQAAAKPSRKQRKHASGGNPNQDLFFMRLRRRQKWVFLALAIVFAVSFVALGVGSGSGGGLQDMYNGLFGGGGDAVAKAQGEIKTDPAKGYQDLANAYVTKNDLAGAIAAMQSFVALKGKKTDSSAWTQLGGYEKTQADTYAGWYQQVLQASAIQSPGSLFDPTGSLKTALGTNPIDLYYSQQNNALSAPLYQKAVVGYQSSLTDFQNAAKYAKPADRADAEQLVANAAQLAGDTKAALHAWQRYVALSPNSPNLTQIAALCKQLGGSCVAKHK
jgi:tetratricopeptide (TPR) repeat protein